MSKKVIFLDRDGTLIQEKHYLVDPTQIVIENTVIEALQRLRTLGYNLVIITNQAGIGRGYFTEKEFHAFQKVLLDMFKAKGITFLDTFFCPHHPTAGQGPYKKDCNCRKPKTGLLEQAISKHDLSLKGSAMIGDKASDILAGQGLGIAGILVKTGYGRHEEKNVTADFVAKSMIDAANYIETHL